MVQLFEGTGAVSLTVKADGTVITVSYSGIAGTTYPLSADAQYRVCYDYIG